MFYGGARGGGKTDLICGDWASHALRYGKHAIGICLRRKSTELDQIKARMADLYCPHWGRYIINRANFEFYNGAVLRMRYCERDKDADNYLGHSYTRLYVEELGTWPDPGPIRKLNATLRSVEGVPCRSIKNSNPGGPGHTWIKAEYIDPAPLGFRLFKSKRENDKLIKCYIPAKVGDNKILIQKDPGYVDRIKSSGPPQLVKAWLEGDWSVIQGAYFPEFGEQHIVRPFKIPNHWTKFKAMDWGSAAPFCVLWFAVATESVRAHDRIIPKGALTVFREYYGWNGEPNVGVRMTAPEVAKRICKLEVPSQKISYGVIDPSTYIESGGPSIAEMLARNGAKFRPADNSRIAGWDQLRDRLKGDDLPMVYIFDTCVNLIRTLPLLQISPTDAEDADSDGEDHAPDTLRYGCMSRPYARKKPAKDKPVLGYQFMTLDELWKRQPQPNKQERI